MSLKEPLFCRLCHEKYSAYESVRRKLKKDNICLGCHIEVEKPYKLFLYDYCANSCGSTRIWKVSPKASKIRLHTLAHYEYVLPQIYRMNEFHAITSWTDVWNKVWEPCFEQGWSSKFKGSLIKGISKGDSSNGIIAFVLDKKNNIYFIDGVWG